MNNPVKTGDQTYWEVEAELSPESEEIWSLFCSNRGGIGAEYISESAERVILRFFFDTIHSSEIEVWLADFRAEFPTVIPPERISVKNCPRENWQDGWRVHFSPLPVGKRLLVCPPWDIPEQTGKWRGRIPVIIDPGQAFGTGNHASTALALEILERRLEAGPNQGRMLDVGTGSGILAIAASLLADWEVWGLDIDGRVMGEIRNNARLNGLKGNFPLIQGKPDCLTGDFNIVTANLTFLLLLTHLKDLCDLTRRGGSLILSGILKRERDLIINPFSKNGLIMVDTGEEEDWFACRFVRNS